MQGVNYGDATGSTGASVILASNPAEDSFTARQTSSHTYANQTRRAADLASNATLSTLLNNANASYRLFTDVNLGQDSQSPRTSVPPFNVGSSGVQTFVVAASDPGGQTLRWRLATNAETQGTQSNPSDFSISPSTGVASFDTTGKPMGLYHASVVIEALAGGSVVSATHVTFLVRVGAGPGNLAPEYVAPNLSIALRATDPDGRIVTSSPGPSGGGDVERHPGQPGERDVLVHPTAAQNGHSS